MPCLQLSGLSSVLLQARHQPQTANTCHLPGDGPLYRPSHRGAGHLGAGEGEGLEGFWGHSWAFPLCFSWSPQG